MHTKDGVSFNRKEYAIPCGVSTSKKIDLSVISDKTSRRKFSFSVSQGDKGGNDGGRVVVVGTSTGALEDGAIAGPGVVVEGAGILVGVGDLLIGALLVVGCCDGVGRNEDGVFSEVGG